MKKLFAAVLLFGLVLCTVSLTAQTSAGLGTITGTVTDQSKAAVPGATVILSNALTGETRTATTNSQGGYQFLNLRVITGYSIKVESKGFSTREVKDIKTSVGSTTNADVTLAVGSESVVISVEGGSSEQVQTETSSLSQLVDSSIWKSSPLEARTQNEFVGLVAGAGPDSAGTGRGYAVNGARTGTGNFLVEGFDNNDQGQGGAGFTFARGGAVTSISPDAIQEYRVLTHVPPAEYGRAGGFATDTVLKSGTNQWHGSLFEYNRIQTLAANSWFSNNSGLRDHRVRNQFGGSIGGPVYKDKTFFYATVEIHRYREGTPSVVTATTQQFLDFVNNGSYQKFMEGTAQQNPAAGQEGICPLYLGTTCPGAFARQSTLGPIFKALYAKYPSSFPLATSGFDNNAQGLLSGGALAFPVPVYGLAGVISTDATNQNRGSLKLDHKLTDKDQLAFTYIADLFTTNLNNGGGDSSPGPAYNIVGGSQVFGTTWTRTWSPSLVTQAKASYLRHVSNFEVPGTAGIPSLYAADSLSTGFGASAGLPQYFTDNQFAYEGSVTKTLGTHTAKAGFRFVRTRNGSAFYNDINGTLIPWSVEGLVTDATADEDQLKTADPADAGVYGSLYYASAALDPTTNSAPDPYRGYRAKEFAAYIQDDWKATQRLTLNYGVRWEYFGPPHNFRAGYDSNVYFGTFGTPTATGNPNLPNTPLLGAVQGAKFIQKDSEIWNKDMNNFAPRFGFAYDTMGNGKLVLRGGFGIGYDRLYNNVYENIRFNYPHFVDNTYGFGAGSAGISPTLRSQLYQAPFTGNAALAVAGAKPVPRHIDQRLVTAYYEQAHFGIQSGFSGYVFEATYVGTFGRKLIGLMNINTFEGRTACPSTVSGTQKALCAAQGYSSYSTARPTSLFNNDNFRTNAFGSNYNGGQVSVRKSFAKGVQMLANYTYSKAMDNTSDVFTVKSGGTGIVSPYNPRYEYGAADFDVRHNLVVTSNIESQWKKDNLLLGGWALSPIFKWRGGSPIYIKNGASTYDPNKDGTTGVDRAVYLGTGNPRNSINHDVSPAKGYITAKTWGAYSCPTVWCDPPVQRNSIYGPRYINLDLGVIKRFAITERQAVTFQTSFFNIFNHPNFDNPIGDTNNANFGKSIGSSDPRITQMSLRYDF